MAVFALAGVVALQTACGVLKKDPEGNDAGECSDAADNDEDGLFDCLDPDCAGSPDCTGTSTGAGTTTGGTVTMGTTTGNTNPGGNQCRWEGTWQVNQAFCFSFDITNDWNDVYADTVMTVSDDGSGSGNCAVVFEWVGGQCTEQEEWTILYDLSDSKMEIRFHGIVSCNPDACEFWVDEGPCLLGDRIAADPILHDVDVLQDGLIRISEILSAGYPSCSPADLVTQWARL
jgi:hypothetical protein